MYFIALVAPLPIQEKVLQWKEFMKEHFGCVVALRSPAHITLVPPFWMNEQMQADLESAIDNFSFEQKPFTIELQDFSAFKPRVIFVDIKQSEELQSLQAGITEHLVAQKIFPVKKEDRLFHPHVSIATRDLHKKSFHDAWQHFQNKKYKAPWDITGISLLRHDQKNWEVIFTSRFNVKQSEEKVRRS